MLAQRDGFDWTEVDTNPASFTTDFVYLEARRNGIKLAPIHAFAALNAGLRVYPGNAAAFEIFLMSDLGLKDQMEVSGIHVSIGKDLAFSQSRKRGHETGLTGPPFSAYDGQLFHANALSIETETEVLIFS
jgi:hypothetical protein